MSRWLGEAKEEYEDGPRRRRQELLVCIAAVVATGVLSLVLAIDKASDVADATEPAGAVAGDPAKQ